MRGVLKKEESFEGKTTFYVTENYVFVIREKSDKDTDLEYGAVLNRDMNYEKSNIKGLETF